MLYYNRVNINEGTDLAKSSNNKECMICYCCIIQNSKCEAINVLKNMFLKIVAIYNKIFLEFLVFPRQLFLLRTETILEQK